MSNFNVVKLLNPIEINLEGGPTFTGAYNNATTYNVGESVSYLGSSYVALASTTGNVPPNASFWQLLAEKGETGTSYQQEYETVSKNLKSWNATFGYTGANLTSIVYTDGVDTITKTFNYTGANLTSIVLSGDTPAGIDLTKTLAYTGADLTSITYS